MEFTPMDVVAYRALDRDALEERQALLQNVLAADELPEGVTLDDLMGEVDMVEECIKRKNAEAKLSRSKLDAVKSGKGKLVAQSDPAPQAQQRGSIHSVNEPEHYSDTMEYRRALAEHILRRRPMPYDMQMRANADIADSINGDFTSVGDFTNVIQHAVAFPHSMMAGIIQKLDEYGNIYSKVQKLTLPGAISYKENELEFTAGWIGDTETTAYQEESDPTAFSFTWHQLEVRHSRTTLANALLTDDLKAMVPPALLKAMVKAIEQAIVRGNGTTQPLGLTVDPRIVGQGTSGESGYIAPRAAIIEVGEDDVDDWKFWHSLLYNTAVFNRLYRESGEWTFGDSTWGMHIDLLHDEVNRPLTKVDVLNDEAIYKLRGRNVNLVEDALLPSFDDASAGDVIGIFGNWNNYVINTQPGMPLSTVQWSDYETNTEKTRVLTALDGRPVYPYGWAILKKKASA